MVKEEIILVNVAGGYVGVCDGHLEDAGC